MPSTVERTWEGDPGAIGGRRARASFRYRAFVPDEIAGLNPAVPFEVADLAAGADAAIRALNERASVGGLEAIGPLLLRSEAVASSRIEGYDVTPLNLARALIDPRAARGSARIVAANVSAMEGAIAIANRTEPVTVADLLAIHAVLMAGDERARPGRVREVQHWIGGRLGNPSDAAFVPPPEDIVLPLLEDLVTFMARDDLPAVPQAAVAHAQFETIHPFIDGNGRVGRALVHVVFRRRGVATRFVPSASRIGRQQAHRAAARPARPLGTDRPGGDRRQPAADARRAQVIGRGRRHPPAECRDLRPPVRGDRAVRPAHGLRAGDHRPGTARPASSVGQPWTLSCRVAPVAIRGVTTARGPIAHAGGVGRPRHRFDLPTAPPRHPGRWSCLSVVAPKSSTAAIVRRRSLISRWRWSRSGLEGDLDGEPHDPGVGPD